MAGWLGLSHAALLLCWVCAQVLDPFRADVGLLSKAGWKASIAELGLLVKRLGCEADMTWFYEHFLARRLLRGRTLGAQEERLAYETLELFVDSSQRVEDMLRDVEASKDLCASFLNHVFVKQDCQLSLGIKSRLFESTYSENEAFFSIMVIAQGHFPGDSLDKGPLRLPSDIQELLDAFHAYYTKSSSATGSSSSGAAGAGSSLASLMAPSPRAKSSSSSSSSQPADNNPSRRKLTLLPRAGSVFLTYVPAKADILVSPTQASALLALWGDDCSSGTSPPSKPKTLEQIAVRLGLADDDRHMDFLQRELQGLCMPNHAVLRVASSSSSAAPGSSASSFELNQPFLDSLAAGSVTVVHTYYASTGLRQAADLDQRISQALGWRLEVVEAAAVRLAKKRVSESPIPLNVMVEELVAAHRHLFECTRQDVLAAINDLVKKGLLTRSASSGSAAPYQMGVSYLPMAEEDAEDADAADRFVVEREGSLGGGGGGGGGHSHAASVGRSPSLGGSQGALILESLGLLMAADPHDHDFAGHERGTSGAFAPSLLRKSGAVEYARSPRRGQTHSV